MPSQNAERDENTYDSNVHAKNETISKAVSKSYLSDQQDNNLRINLKNSPRMRVKATTRTMRTIDGDWSGVSSFSLEPSYDRFTW